MNPTRLIPTIAAVLTVAIPASAWAGAEGPGTPQATAANATFLSNAPVPATGRGVCVIDTGVDTDTDLGPALAGRTTLLGGGGSTDPGDSGALGDSGEPLAKHGTYVSGIIASQVDGKGTSGIWPAAKIYSARVFASGSAAAQVNDYINAINHCTFQPGVKVINLSLSGLGGATSRQRASLDDKIAEVRVAPYNMNVVAAAGNEGSSATVGYPASSSVVFAVGASDSAGSLASFSNRGVGLDIATFGVGACITTGDGTNLATGQGTSFAAPVVSAVLAALRSYDPTLSPDQAEALLLNNADTVGGIKVLDTAKAFRADLTTTAMAAGAPTIGLGAAVTNACEAPHAPSAGGGGGGTAITEETSLPTNRDSTDINTVMSNLPAPAPLVDIQLPNGEPLAARRPTKPLLKSVTLSRGVLTVKVTGRKSGDRAVYWVDRRRFLRSSSTLRVRLHSKKWKTIRVRLQRPGVGLSQALVVRAPHEFYKLRRK